MGHGFNAFVNSEVDVDVSDISTTTIACVATATGPWKKSVKQRVVGTYAGCGGDDDGRVQAHTP